MIRRVGIYPGTFDPLHQGHLAFCLEVIKRGDVDEVVLLPEPLPRGKPRATTIVERHELLEEATTQFPLVSVVALTTDRFTVRETLPELRERFKDKQLSLLIGSDIVPSLHTWNDLDLLLEDMSLIVGLRENDTASGVENTLERIGQTRNLSIRYRLIETDHGNVASSHIRNGKMIANFDLL